MDERLMEAAPVALGVHARDGTWLRVNRALAELNGFPAAELIGKRPSEVHGRLGIVLEEHIRRVAETGRIESGPLTGELGSDPGHERHFEATWFPIDGSVGVSAVEVTQQRRLEAQLAEAHRRDALMARAGNLLSTALSVQETADHVARLVVPEIADWCFVEMVTDDGAIERVAMLHRDPAKEPWIREYDKRFPLDPDAEAGSPLVVRTGEPLVLPDIPAEFWESVATDDEQLALMREVAMTSALVVPLTARGRTLGDIAMTTDAESGRRLGADDLPLAQALADRCAVALDNAQAYHQRDVVAMSLQEGLLPRDLPAIPGLDIAARYAAAGKGNEVGGDFYDVFPSEDGWDVVIGDVVGKGPAAAAVTGLARHTLRAAAAYERSPSALLQRLNLALLAEDPGRRLASVACLRLQPGVRSLAVTVAVGGHPLPLVVRADGSVRELGSYGRLLGVEPDPLFDDVSTVLAPGDLLVLYTDGVTDAHGPWGFFGEERLRALVADCALDAPSRVVKRIESAVLAASGGRLVDDLAVVALRLRPGGTALVRE